MADSQIQELYLHLEHTTTGDLYMAYYGQLRAKEMSHAEALEATIVHFSLRNRDWYRRRMEGIANLARGGVGI